MRLTDRTYTALTAPQRVAALFAALARYDFGEADRLADTAPRQHFVGADFAGDFLRVAMVAAVTVQRIDRAAIAYVAAMGAMSALTHRKGDDWIPEAERMMEAAEAHKQRMRGIWAAFVVNVEPLGLDAFEVAEGIAGLTDMHREILEVEAEPDAEMVEMFRAMLRHA